MEREGMGWQGMERGKGGGNGERMGRGGGREGVEEHVDAAVCTPVFMLGVQLALQEESWK
jgi:hypothetical protein